MNNLKADPRVRFTAAVLGSLAILGAGYGIFHFASTSYVMAKTRAILEKGFPAVAADKVDAYRTSVISRKDGCRLLLDVYFASRKPDRLEWTAQACMESGQESSEAFLGLAVSKEMMGSDAEALRVLEAGIAKFEKMPGLYLRVAQILRRNKNLEEAGKFYTSAVERGPDNQMMILEAMQFFMEAGKNDPARLMAVRLKSAKTDNPEIKLLIARALKRGGDEDGAKISIQEAESLMASNADAKMKLKQAYADVYGERTPAAAPMVRRKTPPQSTAPANP